MFASSWCCQNKDIFMLSHRYVSLFHKINLKLYPKNTGPITGNVKIYKKKHFLIEIRFFKEL